MISVTAWLPSKLEYVHHGLYLTTNEKRDSIISATAEANPIQDQDNAQRIAHGQLYFVTSNN